MKTIGILIMMFFIVGNTFSQTWKSISRIGSYGQQPSNQFIINPYTNDIWFVNPQQLAVIEANGTTHVFPATFSPPFLWGSDLYMAFTPNHVYYAHDNYGLFSFDNYISQLQFSFSEYQGKLYSNQDTVFIVGMEYGTNNNVLVVFDGSGSIITNKVIDNVASKNEFNYYAKGINTLIGYYTEGGGPYVFLSSTDPEYISGLYNDMKFSRLTDTLFVGGKTGISLAHNYDFFDSITPNNTINMPSPNVLEMEWDMEDNLWAVFGNASDKAFAIARLENDTWVNKIDASNSPINFNYFYGLEIDTLNNLWVVDNNALHTLITPNSPAWLSTIEATEFQNFALFPNPSSGMLNFQLENQQATKIVILDLSGRIVEEHAYSASIQTQLTSGTYLVQLMNNELMVGQKQIVIQ